MSDAHAVYRAPRRYDSQVRNPYRHDYVPNPGLDPALPTYRGRVTQPPDSAKGPLRERLGQRLRGGRKEIRAADFWHQESRKALLCFFDHFLVYRSSRMCTLL